ncbi:MAG: type I-B CRISPR-associated protein Cas8b1/Cst1, partial [Sulfurihydrogenibium sp.]
YGGGVRMMEKVYLGDWLYNAGILGFLRILNTNTKLWEIETVGDKKIIESSNESILKFGDNYIEFDRKIFEGFAKNFFDYAFQQYGKYDRYLKLFNEYLEKINQNIPASELESIYKDLDEKIKGYSLLKNKIEESGLKKPDKKEIKKDKNLLVSYLETIIKTMENNRDEFWESDVQTYLRNLLGQKSFLNKSVVKDRYKKFCEDFEEPLKSGNIDKDKKYYCISCNERVAKKDVNFDTGISLFYGLNSDASNFVWNFNTKLPLCEICEIVYFCYFAGITPVRKNNRTVYYFVNSDSSVVDLVSENNILSEILNQNPQENPFLRFFTEYILEASYQKAKFKLQNIAILEIDITNTIMPKVYSFNVSREKAEFIKNQKNNLKEFSKSFYQIKDEKISVLPEILSLILENKLYFNYLNKLTRIYILNDEKTNLTPYRFQQLNLIISDFIKKVGGINMSVSENEMWTVYYKGKELAETLKKKNAENKIQSISYKLLNYLRIGNTNQFMNTLIRTYMAYGEEIPSSFIKALQNKENFYSLGYSFLNGFLSGNVENKNSEVKENG